MNKEYKPLIKKSKRREELLSNKETSIIRKENRKIIKIIAITAIILMSIILLACIIDIYKFFYDLNEYVGYASIAIIVLLLIIFVLRPIIVALSTPCFTLDIANEKSKSSLNRLNFNKLKKVANNLIESDNISPESKDRLKRTINNRDELNLTLREIYDKEIRNKIKEIVNSSAVKVLVSTAISQNSKFDSATVILINIRMIMRIVCACGYHPTYPQLYKLIIKVFRNALIAYAIQSIGIDELIFNGINRLVNGALSSIPILKDVTKSLTQGAANALLTLRIGAITRKYLYEEFDIQAMIEDPETINEEILEEAVNEANSEIDNVINEAKKTGAKTA